MRFCHRHLAVLAPALTLALLSQPARAESSAPPETPAPISAPVDGARVELSLQQAVARFGRENLRLAAARYEINATRADIISAGLLPNPRLSLSGGWHIHGESDSADQQYAIMLAQSLPIWGRLGASKDAARLTSSATERGFAAEGWQLLGELRRAYLALQLAAGHHGVLKAGLRDLERVQRVLEARTAAGANPVYDRVRLEVERGSLRARIARAEVDVSDAGAGLSAAIGGTPSAGEPMAADPLVEPLNDNRDAAALVQWAFEHRQEIAAMHLETGAADARLSAARKRFMPEPELGIGYSHWRSIPGAPPGSSGGGLLASASIPLPLFDRGQGTVERQLEQTRAARVHEQDLKNIVQREVEHAARTLHSTTAAYRAFREEASHNAETVRRIAELTYREGRGTILELLDAYSSYLRVEEQALELRGAALYAALELEQAVGPVSP
ncbi:MAG TPA: TolC family protein [Polyangiaceae bacterium]|nr:TolC family protein [Polyangiaceae bacterium]